MNTTIISGFSGVGKTTCRHPVDGFNPNVMDLESSVYSWIVDWSNPSEPPKRNPEFPKNYVDALEGFLKLGGYEYIFISSHKEVRQELQVRGIKYCIVAPKNTPELKDEYCRRYLKRGSHIDLIDMVYRKWDELLDSIESDPSPTIWLNKGEYLADILSKEGE